MDPNQLWQAVLGELEILISKANFTTWFKNTFIFEYGEHIIIIGVPNAFTKAWLEKKYNSQIVTALANITNEKKFDISYKVATKSKVEKTDRTSKTSATTKKTNFQTNARGAEQTTPKFGLNTRYTFEKFVVGTGNELAHAAAKAILKKPGETYNPLFIYGGVGLGKTHLIQAIGHALLEQAPKTRILYVNSEKFTNDFVAAIKHGSTENFKKLYRTVDVLLIDDIQFIAGKEQTQEEFFHTFNTLHQNNKQIVISSDRPPKAIPSIENRLISRFEWGMTADISAPDLETRIAILETKCQEKEIVLEADIIRSIAENVQENIRELEGALNRILAYHELSNSTPTRESAKSLLVATSSKPQKGGLTSKKLIQQVADFFDVPLKDLTGACRKKELVVPRQISMYLMRKEMSCSYPYIGQQLGGRDHTTAMHACTKVEQYLSDNEKVRNDIALLRQQLYE